MQVAHQHDHITHAVIGGAQAINFGISDSAEFFNILSSTLYSDQILAVVREVLCNAWDAHIEAGCTDKPVEITIENNKFIIRDFGTGIHRDDMGPIYGTYGNSTKKNDGKQTGGFGLGCKAPFAYTDHFEVISHHDGVKTIYNLSKSSAQAQGKPGIVPIVSFPCTESGLQVTIDIKNNVDLMKFKQLVQRIVRNGDMNMMLNGQHINKLGFNTTKGNYFITLASDILEKAPKVMVRYGNVIYPVEKVDALRGSYARIEEHLNKMQGRNHTYRIVFQAIPHSISVTPSREALSMQDHTVKSLQALFDGFFKQIDNPSSGFRQLCDGFAERAIGDAVQQKEIKELLHPDARLPGVRPESHPPSLITDFDSMAKRYMQVNYPVGHDFRVKDITWRLTKMVDAKLLDRGLVQTYLRALSETTGDWGGARSDWLQRRVIAPLVAKMVKAGIDIDKLYAYDQYDRNAPDRVGVTPLVHAKSISPENIFNAIPYLRNMIVLSNSARTIKDRAQTRQAFTAMGHPNGFLFYHTSAKKKEREDATAFFHSLGMHVVDLNEKTAHEKRMLERKAVTASVRKPKEKGLPALSCLLDPATKAVNTHRSKREGMARIEKPEFIIQVSLRAENSKESFGGWDKEASRYIIDLFGAKGGITSNSAVHAKLLGTDGIRNMNAYIVDMVCAEMLSNPRIRENWAFDADRATMEYSPNLSGSTLVDFAYESKQLQKEFGLVNNLTESDKKYIFLYNKLLSEWSHRNNDVVSKTKQALRAIPLHPANKKLLARFNENEDVLEIFDVKKMKALIKGPESEKKHVKAALEALIAALK